jgi:hypothetical protein
MELNDFLKLYFKRHNNNLAALEEIIEYDGGNSLVSINHLLDIYFVRDESYRERHNSKESPFTNFLNELSMYENSLQNVRMHIVQTNVFTYIGLTDPFNQNILADLQFDN